MATTPTPAQTADKVLTFKKCVSTVYNDVNRNAKAADGTYPCRDVNNPCYTLTMVDKIIYSYVSYVMKKEIPVFSENEAEITATTLRVSQLTGYPQDGVRAVMYWMWKGYKAGTVEKSCIDPLSNNSAVLAYGLGATGLVAVCFWIGKKIVGHYAGKTAKSYGTKYYQKWKGRKKDV
jgi:hypothetical protein